jgi:hypothetical protein
VLKASRIDVDFPAGSEAVVPNIDPRGVAYMRRRSAPVVPGRALVGSRAPRLIGVFVVVGFLSASAAPSASAAIDAPLPCTARDSSPVFARWLDPALYFQASNGGFERGAEDWTLGAGASVAGGNESFGVGGASDSHSLVLTAGASAESRTACLTLGEPTMRMFVKAPRTLGAALRIDASVENPTTGVTLQTSSLVLAGVGRSQWAPTPEILLPNLLGGIVPENLTIRVTAVGVPATWSVDDVYVDPFKSR